MPSRRVVIDFEHCATQHPTISGRSLRSNATRSSHLYRRPGNLLLPRRCDTRRRHRPIVVMFLQHGAACSPRQRRPRPSPMDVPSVLFIRTFQILRKATNSAECCLFRRFCKISAVFLFWRTVLNTRPRRFDRIFAKGQAASTIFRREYAARGFGRTCTKRLSPEAEGKWCGATDQGVSENSRPAVRA